MNTRKHYLRIEFYKALIATIAPISFEGASQTDDTLIEMCRKSNASFKLNTDVLSVLRTEQSDPRPDLDKTEELAQCAFADLYEDPSEEASKILTAIRIISGTSEDAWIKIIGATESGMTICVIDNLGLFAKFIERDEDSLERGTNIYR